MEGFLVFFFDVVIALFAFFVVAPCILNAVSLFGVQKRFADMMIKEGVSVKSVSSCCIRKSSLPASLFQSLCLRQQLLPVTVRPRWGICAAAFL